MTISISKLKADRTGMHKPENWRHDESQRRFIEISGSIFHLDDSANARGVVATVHAADALIAIAEAAMVWSRTLHGDRVAELDALMAALAKVSP